jgi:hypothetical protein
LVEKPIRISNDTICMVARYHQRSPRLNINKYSPCQVYALFAVILNLILPLPESSDIIRSHSGK